MDLVDHDVGDGAGPINDDNSDTKKAKYACVFCNEIPKPKKKPLKWIRGDKDMVTKPIPPLLTCSQCGGHFWNTFFDWRSYRIKAFVLLCLFFSVFIFAFAVPVAMDTFDKVSASHLPEVFVNSKNMTYLETEPKIVEYEYTLRGEEGYITYTVYGGLNEVLKAEPRYIEYYYIEPSDVDFINKMLDDWRQEQYLDPFVTEIESITPDRDDQARIAISLVQNIDYDYESVDSINFVNKYPYEVLYTEKGVCGGKSALLAYLLRELGYEVAIFRFDVEKHDAVGIACPHEYSYRGTGYCFVESTTPSIVTDTSMEYRKVGELTSMPKVIKICDGDSFDSVYEEYYDNLQYYSLQSTMDSYPYGLNHSEYEEWKAYQAEWMQIVEKYGIALEN